MHIFTFSRPSVLLLYYGIFAVICHATAILFLALYVGPSSPTLMYNKFFPMIEHSLVSFISILIGVVGIEYIKKQK